MPKLQWGTYSRRKLAVAMLIEQGKSFSILNTDLNLAEFHAMEKQYKWIKEYDSMFGRTYFVFTEEGLKTFVRT